MVKHAIYKHENMTSAWHHKQQKIYNFSTNGVLFPTKHSWKFFLANLNIFYGDIKENVSECFLLNTVYMYIYLCGYIAYTVIKVG